MNQNIQMIADLLHKRDCLEEAERSCRRWTTSHETGVRHRAFYNQRAEEIYGKLEPEIGGANVLLAVQVVTEGIGA